MSHLGNVLVCFLLLVTLCQTNADGLRTSSSSQGTSLVSNALVGLAAVTGFLFIVFFILIIKRLFFKKDSDDEESDPEVFAAYENKALEVETPHSEETRMTNL